MVQTQKYKVVLERENCIGAAACVTIYSKRWELASDGKAKIKGAKPGKIMQELIISKKEFEKMKQSAQNCPVNAIHIYETKTNRKII